MRTLLAKNHKGIEAIGLVFALIAWGWDIGVQSISRRADVYERQLLHIIASGQAYAARDRASLAAVSGALAVKYPELDEEKLAAAAWKESVFFRERWWEHSNTIAMWLDRTLFFVQRYGEELELPPPASFAATLKLNNETHALLHPGAGKGHPLSGSRDVLRQEQAFAITKNLDKLSESVQAIAAEVVYTVQRKREYERKWQLAFAAVGASLIVLGKLFAWKNDRDSKSSREPESSPRKGRAR